MFNCTANNIGTRKIVLLFLLISLIDLTRYLQLYDVKKKKNPVAFLLFDPGWFVHILYRNMYSLKSRLHEWDDKKMHVQRRLYSGENCIILCSAHKMQVQLYL